MVETAKGIDRILLFRQLSKASTNAAGKLAFQTEHEASKSRDVESTSTKDGNVQALGAIEEEVSVTSILAKGDEFVTELEDAFDAGEVIEIWDIDRGGESEDNKYPAKYYQGYITEFTQSPNSEDDVELSMSFAINGLGQRGLATLTDAQADVVQYVFQDTTVAPEGV